jgi:hypothetical protein
MVVESGGLRWVSPALVFACGVMVASMAAPGFFPWKVVAETVGVCYCLWSSVL